MRIMCSFGISGRRNLLLPTSKPCSFSSGVFLLADRILSSGYRVNVFIDTILCLRFNSSPQSLETSDKKVPFSLALRRRVFLLFVFLQILITDVWCDYIDTQLGYPVDDRVFTAHAEPDIPANIEQLLFPGLL